MTRQVRNIDQIRSLLRQMDRSVDDARSRREGAPRPISNANGSQQQQAFPPQSPSPAPGTNGPARSLTNGNAHGHAPRPTAPPPSMMPSGNGNGATAPSAPGAPARLKAKPKRSAPESGGMGSMGDPLQDFHKRQAS